MNKETCKSRQLRSVTIATVDCWQREFRPNSAERVAYPSTQAQMLPLFVMVGTACVSEPPKWKEGAAFISL